MRRPSEAQANLAEVTKLPEDAEQAILRFAPAPAELRPHRSRRATQVDYFSWDGTPG